tara:strand:- start:424 stop:1101 length:678 start_codon:yes stop_codon:yes gene_type:complete
MSELKDMVPGVELYDVAEQRRDEWLEKRAGTITCSHFGELIGSGTKGDPFTKTGLTYLRRVVAEQLGSSYTIAGRALDWGTTHETAAIEAYSEKIGSTVLPNSAERIGEKAFIAMNEFVGGTPDALVGSEGCLEVKCPYDPAVHVETLLTRQIPARYVWQCTGHLLVTGRKWVDFVSYDPRINSPASLCVIRCNRHQESIDFLHGRINTAVDWVTAKYRQVREQV